MGRKDRNERSLRSRGRVPPRRGLWCLRGHLGGDWAARARAGRDAEEREASDGKTAQKLGIVVDARLEEGALDEGEERLRVGRGIATTHEPLGLRVAERGLEIAT